MLEVGKLDRAKSSPVPDRGTTCGLLKALSVIVIVPALLPEAVGVNVMVTVQVKPAGIEGVQAFICEKSPDTVTLETANGAVLLFVMVALCALLVVPTTCPLKGREPGATPAGQLAS